MSIAAEAGGPGVKRRTLTTAQNVPGLPRNGSPGGRDIPLRIPKGNDRVGDHRIRQPEQLALALHPLHLGPCAQPYRANAQRMGTQADAMLLISSGRR